MTPEQSRAQVIDAAREALRILGIKSVDPVFYRESCNDQQEAPFRGVVHLDYDHAPTLDGSRAEIQRMLATLKQHGWSSGGDFHTHSPSVTRNGVTAVFNTYIPNGRVLGGTYFYGECRDMTTKERTSGVPIPPSELS
jgi:hypothetical protein